MQRRTKFLIAIAVVALAVAVIGTTAAVGSSDDTEPPITGVELEKATDAAVGYLGEGTVTDTEVGDEESYYEVEVTLDDGTQVDVQLDESFAVVGSERDGDEDED